MDDVRHFPEHAVGSNPPDAFDTRRRAFPIAAAIRPLSLLSFAVAWWAAAHLASNPQILPAPDRLLAFAWQELRGGALPLNIGITLARVIAAFAIAMVVGSVVGYLAGRSPRLDAVIDPWMVVTLNLPLLVVVVLSYVWLGLNEGAAVLAVAIAKTPTVFITIREGARALDPALKDLETVYRLPLSRRLWWVTVPQLLPYIAAASRSGLSITWKIVLVVELLGRPNGVGFVLNLYFQSFNVTGILTYGLSFAAIMLVVETTVLQPWERRANAWRRRA
ncbi:MAG: ABC transporter permease subunit [Acetobacteraceae bacterium]|nr:ABC transporter permease subunit [Acetobacteraceae bacterium]